MPSGSSSWHRDLSGSKLLHTPDAVPWKLLLVQIEAAATDFILTWWVARMSNASARAADIASSIPRVMSRPKFNDLVVTRNDSLIVSRMRLEVDEIIDGKKAENNARS